jgi:hypothetical protein
MFLIGRVQVVVTEPIVVSLKSAVVLLLLSSTEEDAGELLSPDFSTR